jgi:O-antigen/teichoic acid export membrane protein
LNVILIYLYGWLGAAVATAVSAGLSYVSSYAYASSLIEFSFPRREVLYQILASVIMGGVVYSGIWTEDTFALLQSNIVLVLTLVLIGAGVYFGSLLTLSTQFRDTVTQNLSFEPLRLF